MVALFACILSLQQKKLLETQYFPGGLLPDFITYLRGSGTKIGAVYEERVARAFGPMRCLNYSDGTRVYDPPIPPTVEAVIVNGFAIFRSKLLPPNYYIFDVLGTIASDNKDTATMTQSVENGRLVSRISGAMRLGNGLPLLGYPVRIHPFFDDFWVNVSSIGKPDERYLEVIALTVGGTLRRPDKPEGNYMIEPDSVAIRARLLKTLDFKTPSKSIPEYEARDAIVLQIAKELSNDQLRKWIDCARMRKRFNANELPQYKKIKSYRDQFVNFAAKSSPAFFTEQNVESLKASAIEVEFGPKFSIAFYATLADGKQMSF